MMTNDIQVIYMPLPLPETVTQNEDGSYTIFINEEMCEQKKWNAYCHALDHIENDDFCSCMAADQIEYYTHNYSHN